MVKDHVCSCTEKAHRSQVDPLARLQGLVYSAEIPQLNNMAATGASGLEDAFIKVSFEEDKGGDSEGYASWLDKGEPLSFLYANMQLSVPGS